MKKILSISLALLMLVCLCFSVTSCEQDTAFGKYYSYLEGLENQMDEKEADGITTVVAKPLTNIEDDTKEIMLVSSVKATGAVISVTLYLTENTSTYHFVFSIMSDTNNSPYIWGEGDVDALSYTGNELVAFDTYKDYSYNTNYYETDYRSTATNLLKTLVLSMKPMMAKANVDVKDFYFISVDFPEADLDAEGEEDLGGAFSAERWLYVGQMLVVGLGMVFLVLAILWIILLIFEKAMGTGEKPAKPAKPAPAKADKSAPAPQKQVPAAPAAPAVTPAADDGALVAAITAAIAATIASDEGLSRQFASGFRVVSFRKKSGKGAWND